MNQVTLIPAYGRDYPSQRACRQAWLDGKDFQIAGGPYVSVRDLDALRARYEWIVIRYADSKRIIHV